MKFARPDRSEADWHSYRKYYRGPMLDDRRRILRDMAMLILKEAGLSVAEILRVIDCFANDPIRSHSHVTARIAVAKSHAASEARRRGIIQVDDAKEEDWLDDDD